MRTIRQLSIDEQSAGMRLDLFLASQRAEAAPQGALSRSEIQRLIAAGQITLNGVAAKPSTRIKVHDHVEIRSLPARETDLKPEALPLDILYEDADCLVINKPSGIVVHPAAGRASGTLVNALLHHCADLPGIGGERRPGIVHRLDKETSGVMIVAKNMLAFQKLVAQFKNRAVLKEYLGLAWGTIVPAEGRVDRPIGRHRSDRKRMSSTHFLQKARPALTEWRVEEHFALSHEKSRASVGVSLVRLRPRTGRTHQLRVHLADMGYPLVGDRIYGRKRKGSTDQASDRVVEAFARQALHAEKLAIEHVRTGRRMEFSAPLADDMRELLGYLRALNAGVAAKSSNRRERG